MIVVPAKTDEKENTTMAEAKSLTTREAVEGVLASELSAQMQHREAHAAAAER
jgi:hypothetical protein